MSTTCSEHPLRKTITQQKTTEIGNIGKSPQLSNKKKEEAKK